MTARDGDGDRKSGGDPAAVADYIGELGEQLSRLASNAGLELLAYLLDMVRVEADLIKKRGEGDPAKP